MATIAQLLENPIKLEMKNEASAKMIEWQFRKLMGQLLLTQEHSSDLSCPCELSSEYEYCLPKHLIAIQSYAEETMPMTENGKAREVLQGIAGGANDLRRAYEEAESEEQRPYGEITEFVRQGRKDLEPLLFTYKQPNEKLEAYNSKEAGMESREMYFCANQDKHPHGEILQISTLEENPKCPYCGAVMTYGRFWGGTRLAQQPPKTIQQLFQEQELLEQHQKDRPQDIIFFKDTIMKHYYPKEDFYPDSFRVVKPEPGVMVTLGCLKKNKWYPERLECVPTQDIHRTIVPRTEKYIKEAEEWAAVGVPTQHRETEVGIVPRELAEVISANMEVCLARNGRKPESMSVADIQSELNALLYDEAVRKACDAKDRELLSIVIAQGKAGHFDFLTGKTEWKVRGKWRRPENDFDIEENVQLDVEFRDASDECVGKRIIELLKSYNKKAIGEELLYARTSPIEEGTL